MSTRYLSFINEKIMKDQICIKIKHKLVKNSKVMTAGKGRDKRVR